jgi:alkyl hydroperoxide reductase subunit AhpF
MKPTVKSIYVNIGLMNNVNLLEDNINIINKNTEALIDASKKVGLDMNTE